MASKRTAISKVPQGKSRLTLSLEGGQEGEEKPFLDMLISHLSIEVFNRNWSNSLKLKGYPKKNKGLVHAKMGSIMDRNGIDITEAEDIKKKWQEYTEEVYKKDNHDPDNHSLI